MTDDIPALSPEARAVLDALRGAHDPPPGTALRARPALDLRMRRAQSRARSLRWGVVLGLATFVALLVARVARPPAPPPPAPARVASRAVTPSAPSTTAPAVAPVPTTPTPAPTTPAPSPAPTTPPTRAPLVAPSCSTRIELQAIREADAALRAGDATHALRTTRALARRCPRGAMIEEREALRVMALCRAQEPTASAELRRFLAAWPRSPIHERVEAQCATR